MSISDLKFLGSVPINTHMNINVDLQALQAEVQITTKRKDKSIILTSTCKMLKDS